MTRCIPQGHNYRTACPAAIKTKITALVEAAMLHGAACGQHENLQESIKQDVQAARYNLERTILTCIEAAVAAALDPNTKRTK